MEVELMHPIIAATERVIETIAQISPVSEPVNIKQDRHTWGVVSGVIGMVSEKLSGNIIVSFERDAALFIVGRMLMEEMPEFNQDVVDAVGEITNMITGAAKRLFAEEGHVFGMATPFMIVGENVELSQHAQGCVLQSIFRIPAGAFVVEANLAVKS